MSATNLNYSNKFDDVYALQYFQKIDAIKHLDYNNKNQI